MRPKLPCRRLLQIACLLGLAGCQPPPRLPDQASAAPPPPPVTEAGLDPGLPCPDGIDATLTTGLLVSFDGGAPDDPEVCLESWDGRAHRFFRGVWGAGRFGHGTPEQRRAILTALTGPVGTRASFPLHPRSRRQMWRAVEIEHLPNAIVRVDGVPREAVRLRMVRVGAAGHREVRAPTIWLIDRATGVPLRQDVVTPMADREDRYTVWQVGSLDESSS